MVVDVIAESKTETRAKSTEFSRKSVYFVVGAEGSGTYMLSEALVAAGCVYDGRMESDDFPFREYWKTKDANYVVRRSLPHAGIWPNSMKITEAAIHNGYLLHVIAIIRNGHSAYQSVIRRDPERNRANIKQNQIFSLSAISSLFSRSGGTPTIITYEAFVGSKSFRKWLFDARLGLYYPEDFEVYDGNDKYY